MQPSGQIINLHGKIEKFKNALKTTYSADQSQQIKLAEQYIQSASQKKHFPYILAEIFAQSSTNLRDQNLQKALLTLLERLIIDCYCKNHNRPGNYQQSQRLLSIMFDCLNNLSVKLSVKRKVSKIIRSTIQLQDSQFRREIIQNIQTKFGHFAYLISNKQNASSLILQNIESILLYGDIISQDFGFSTASFAFSKNCLIKFTQTLLFLLEQIANNCDCQQDQQKSNHNYELALLNIQIVSTMISKNQVVQHEQVFSWLSDPNTLKMFEALIYIDGRLREKQRYYQNDKNHNNFTPSKNHFRTNNFSLYNRVLDFLTKQQQNNQYAPIQSVILDIFSTKIAPYLFQTSAHLIINENPHNLSKLRQSLDFLQKSLHFHTFYGFLSQNLTKLLDQVIIPIISMQTTIEQKRAQDYLQFSDFLSGKDKKSDFLICENIVQDINSQIRKKNPSILPYQILEFEQLYDDEKNQRNEQKLRNKFYHKKEVSIFQCQQISVKIIKKCLRKIDGFSAFYFKILECHFENFQTTSNKKQTIFVLLTIAKQTSSQYPLVQQKIMNFFDRYFQKLSVQVFTIDDGQILNDSHSKSLNFNELVLFLCSFRAYFVDTFSFWEERQTQLNTFHSYLTILDRILSQLNLRLIAVNLNDAIEEQRLTAGLLILYILKDIVTQNFGDLYFKIVFSRFMQIEENIRIDSKHIQRQESNLFLRFLNTFFSILDETIEYFSYELQKSLLLRSLVQNCVEQLLEIYHLQTGQCHLLDILKNLLWRTLLNVLSQKMLLKGLVQEYFHLLEGIVHILKTNPTLKQTLLQSHHQLESYTLIVANSLMKAEKKIRKIHVQMLSLFIGDIAYNDKSPSFGHVFQFLQCVMFFSKSHQNKQLEKITQEDYYEYQNGQDFQIQQINKKQCLQQAQISHAQINTILDVCLNLVREQFSKRAQLKRCQGIVLLQQLFLSNVQFLDRNKIITVLEITIEIAHQFSSTKDSSQYPLFQNCFSILLILLPLIDSEDYSRILDQILSINHARKSIPVNFQYCTKLNILCLLQLFELKTEDIIIRRLKQQIHSIEPPQQKNEPSNRTDNNTTINQNEGLNGKISKYQGVYKVFNLIMECLQQDFNIQRLPNFCSSESNDNVQHFELVEISIQNKFTKMDHVQQTKNCFQGRFMDGSNKRLSTTVRQIANQSNQDQQKLMQHILYSCQRQFLQIIDLCIAQTDCVHQGTIRTLIMTEKVNNSHRKIFRVK